jgi:hypothetical protein
MRAKTAAEKVKDLHNRIARLEKLATFLEFEGKLYDRQTIREIERDPSLHEKWLNQENQTIDEARERLIEEENFDETAKRIHRDTRLPEALVGKQLQKELKSLGASIRVSKEVSLEDEPQEYKIILSDDGRRKIRRDGWVNKGAIKDHIHAVNRRVKSVLKQMGVTDYDLIPVKAYKGMYDVGRVGFTHHLVIY